MSGANHMACCCAAPPECECYIDFKIAGTELDSGGYHFPIGGSGWTIRGDFAVPDNTWDPADPYAYPYARNLPLSALSETIEKAEYAPSYTVAQLKVCWDLGLIYVTVKGTAVKATSPGYGIVWDDEWPATNAYPIAATLTVTFNDTTGTITCTAPSGNIYIPDGYGWSHFEYEWGIRIRCPNP